MSKLSSLVLGMAAGATMFGAIQYASGNDLRGTISDATKAATDGVNRAAKGDRSSIAVAQTDPSQTLSFRLQGLSDTSVLIRLAGTPVKNEPANAVKPKNEAINTPVAPTNARPQRAAVGCEPPVSVLSEMAKILQPGRCVT